MIQIKNKDGYPGIKEIIINNTNEIFFRLYNTTKRISIRKLLDKVSYQSNADYTILKFSDSSEIAKALKILSTNKFWDKSSPAYESPARYLAHKYYISQTIAEYIKTICSTAPKSNPEVDFGVDFIPCHEAVRIAVNCGDSKYFVSLIGQNKQLIRSITNEDLKNLQNQCIEDLEAEKKRGERQKDPRDECYEPLPPKKVPSVFSYGEIITIIVSHPDLASHLSPLLLELPSDSPLLRTLPPYFTPMSVGPNFIQRATKSSLPSLSLTDVDNLITNTINQLNSGEAKGNPSPSLSLTDMDNLIMDTIKAENPLPSFSDINLNDLFINTTNKTRRDEDIELVKKLFAILSVSNELCKIVKFSDLVVICHLNFPINYTAHDKVHELVTKLTAKGIKCKLESPYKDSIMSRGYQVEIHMSKSKLVEWIERNAPVLDNASTHQLDSFNI